MLAVCALCAASLVPALPAAAGSATPPIAEIRIEGVINPVQARYVEQSLATAKTRGAQLVLLSLNTPGGLVASMQEIVSSITNSGLPVIGLVEPSTAQATSAGAFILLATDLAAMLPDTRVGAAHPVGAGEKLDETMAAKATNSLVSLAKSLAKRRGRSESAAEAMVRDSASYTASEARDKQIVEWEVSSRADLLARLNGHTLDFADRKVTLSTAGAEVIELPMSRTDRVLNRLAEPTLASILLSIGVLGIIYELSAPGIGLGGIVGVMSLLLGLLGMSVLPINLVGPLLMVAGVGAIAIELHVPTHGLLGGGGVIALTLGGLLLVDGNDYFGAVPHIDWRVQTPITLLIGALIFLLAAQGARALEARLITGPEAMIGLHGRAGSSFVRTEQGYSGDVKVEGVYWRATSTGAIADGDSVEVVDVRTRPLQLEVRRIERGRV
jgi:membrane-bound serine protease (ClpP class)